MVGGMAGGKNDFYPPPVTPPCQFLFLDTGKLVKISPGFNFIGF
jgi:hypothetical protein